MFHNSLLTPYKETEEHGTNYKCPPPELINNEDQHYEVENMVDSKLSQNHRGVLYLVKWKGYPSSENSWEPSLGMKHAKEAT